MTKQYCEIIIMKQHVLYLAIQIDIPMNRVKRYYKNYIFENSDIVAILHSISPIVTIYFNINMHATYLDQIYPKNRMFAFASLW